MCVFLLVREAANCCVGRKFKRDVITVRLVLEWRRTKINEESERKELKWAKVFTRFDINTKLFLIGKDIRGLELILYRAPSLCVFFS